MINLLLFVVINFLYLYMYIIIAFIFMGWIPDLRKSKFYEVVRIITEPFFRIFRGIIVFNGLDFTPMVGIILYQFFLEFALARL